MLEEFVYRCSCDQLLWGMIIQNSIELIFLADIDAKSRLTPSSNSMFFQVRTIQQLWADQRLRGRAWRAQRGACGIRCGVCGERAGPAVAVPREPALPPVPRVSVTSATWGTGSAQPYRAYCRALDSGSTSRSWLRWGSGGPGAEGHVALPRHLPLGSCPTRILGL